eukprot:11876687-Heterocapsa_arctica.AAC.1
MEAAITGWRLERTSTRHTMTMCGAYAATGSSEARSAVRADSRWQSIGMVIGPAATAATATLP